MGDFVSWLKSERLAYRARCGAPRREDLRACGVTLRQIRDYMRGAGWQCAVRDTGDCRTERGGQKPAWLHPTYPEMDMTAPDTYIVSELARWEERSPWDVLDDCAHYAGPREIYHEDQIVATIHGALITPANNS